MYILIIYNDYSIYSVFIPSTEYSRVHKYLMYSSSNIAMPCNFIECCITVLIKLT